MARNDTLLLEFWIKNQLLWKAAIASLAKSLSVATQRHPTFAKPN